MNWFSLLYSGCLLASHAYLYCNFRRAFGCGLWNWFAFVYVALVFLTHFTLRGWLYMQSWGSTAFDVRDYCLGFALVACIVFFFGDAVRILAWLAGKAIGTNKLRWTFSTRYAKWLVALSVLVYGYALYEARAYRVVRLEITTPLLPEGRDRLRIAAVSDIHIDRLNDWRHVSRIVKLVNAERPDIVALVGDIVDADLRRRAAEREAFLALTAAHRYAVIGNHEVFRGMHQAIDFMEKSGFTMLRGSVAEADGILVAGVDDPFGGGVDSARLLADVEQDKFVLLLSHRPIVPDASLGRFDLQVSGHTHGGQIFLVRPLARWFFGQPQGLSIFPPPAGLEKTSRLYVMNGAGFWGPPVRLLTPPDILIVDLVRG
jgi:predicted MPP superfamily phosphohydrolase